MDGSAEVLNNFYERRMRSVKLPLKSCTNIGSEIAAADTAFIFSQIESYKLNNINLQDYLRRLFECILHGRDVDKRVLLHIIIEINVKTKLFSYSFFLYRLFYSR